MPAYRIIDDHKDLENVGSLTHVQIDEHVSGSTFVFVSGSAPPLGRRIAAGSNITIVDGGPGGELVISAPVASYEVIFPTGSVGQIPFNTGGSIGASSALTFNPTTGALSAPILSGSLTTLSDGSPYLIGGSNISVVTNSNGSITISSTVSPSGGGSGTIQMMCWNDNVIGEVNGMNMIFELSNAPNPQSSLMFYVNGVLQKQGWDNDYNISNNLIVTTSAPQEGSTLTATYMYTTSPAPGSSIAWMEVPGGEADGTNNTFTLVNSPIPSTALMFHYNGVLQRQGLDYVLSGSTVTMTFIPNQGSKMLATYPY